MLESPPHYLTWLAVLWPDHCSGAGVEASVSATALGAGLGFAFGRRRGLGCWFRHGGGGLGFGVALLDRAADSLAAARSAASAAVAHRRRDLGPYRPAAAVPPGRRPCHR